MKKLDKYLLALLVIVLAVHYAGFLSPGPDGDVLFAVSFIGTVPVLISAFVALKNRKISVDLLASIALVASLLTQEWASAVFINLMLTSARLFGYYTSDKARAAIKSLLKLRPEIVKVKRGGRIVSIPEKQVAIGDLVVVESGDRLAVDGEVVEGAASIDQSSLTGESMPVEKIAGDDVFSSTLAVSGSLIVKATRVGADTTLQKIVGLVENAQGEKATIRGTADKFASWYIGLTLIGSIGVFVVFRDLNLLLSLLLVACADDIAVAIPLAFLAAIGYAARRGVIIKGGAYLEGLAKARIFVMDKTGTITRGQLAVRAAVPADGFSRNDLLAFAGAAESVSEHPIARSILKYVEGAKIKFAEPEKFVEVPGKGIAIELRGKPVLAGKEEFLAEKNVPLSEAEASAVHRAEEAGDSVTLIAAGGRLAGFIATADEIRPMAKTAIAHLKALGVRKVAMLTGDNDRVARTVAEAVGATEYRASLLPEDKLAYIKGDIGREGKLVMVGDGVNDAAALALADVGVAMGAIGSDAAIEAADVALMRDDLEELPRTIALGRYTEGVARQDFWIWGIVNAVGLVLVIGRIIGPEGAAAFNFVTDFFPLLNSLRLFDLHLKLK